MGFERPELSRALREMAEEKDTALARKRTYVDYRADGTIERITWPPELGKKPAKKDIDARVAAVRQRRAQMLEQSKGQSPQTGPRNE
jgi:hypothetical protein